MELLPLRAERIDENYLNPVQFSLNCFLAALFMELPGPVMFVVLGDIICVGGGGRN